MDCVTLKKTISVGWGNSLHRTRGPVEVLKYSPVFWKTWTKTARLLELFPGETKPKSLLQGTSNNQLWLHQGPTQGANEFMVLIEREQRVIYIKGDPKGVSQPERLTQ